MGEREDILALSFVVGGQINDLKKQTEGMSNSKFVSAGLEDPKQFIQKMAKADISEAVAIGKHDLMQRMHQASPEGHAQQAAPPMDTKQGVSQIPTPAPAPAPAPQAAPQAPPVAPQATPLPAATREVPSADLANVDASLRHMGDVLADIAVSMHGIFKILTEHVGSFDTRDTSDQEPTDISSDDPNPQGENDVEKVEA